MASSSPSTINNLPLEILLEILYKLPVDELHRNKIVCKVWSSLISHHSFRFEYLHRINSSSNSRSRRPSFTWYETYYNSFSEIYRVEHFKMLQNGENSITLTMSKDDGEFLPDQEIPGKKSDYNVIASSKGLLLCRKSYGNLGHIYYVVNPLTRQWRIIPSPSSAHTQFDMWGIVCFESENCSSQTQFKVVKILIPYRIRNPKFLNMEIFESATNKWRLLNTILIDVKKTKGIFKICNSIEHNRILYWEQRNFIITFDPSLDMCRQISLPIKRGYHSNTAFGISQGHLYYVHIHYDGRQDVMCTIWRFDEFEGKYIWNVHGRFNLEWIRQRNPDLFRKEESFILFAIDPLNCNVLYVLLWDDPRRYFALDLERREMGELKLNLISKHSDDDGLRYKIDNIVMVQPTWPTTVVFN